MAKKLIVEIVGDERSYLRAAQNTLASNEKLGVSFRQVGVNANLSADAQIKAAVKSREALTANVVGLRSRAAALPVGSAEQTAAFALAANAQTKLNRSIGVSTVSTRQFSTATKAGERDLNKIVRGGLAGSGIFSRLGRSLAFASSGFIAVSVGAAGIAKSITSANTLEEAQASLSVAIRHTGGSLGELLPRYEATAKAAAQFGITQADATTGLARATVLTGNAAEAQRAYQEALVISKATGKDFNSVLIATSKGQEGITTSLRRYGILVDTSSSGTEQFRQVMKRFGGQAEANTTQVEKLGAVLTNTLAAVGVELLPTFNRLTASSTAWLTRMQRSGRLQKDVNRVITDVGNVFHDLEAAVRGVDRVTGGFANTLKLLIGLKVASLVAGWVASLKVLAASWGTVTAAAETATAAEGAALGTGALGGVAAAGVAGGAAEGAAIQKSVGRNVAAASETGLATGVAAGATVAAGKLGGLKAALSKVWVIPVVLSVVVKSSNKGQNVLDQIGLGFLGKLPLVGALDQQIARIIRSGTGLTPPKPLTSDTTFTLGGQRFIAGTGEAFQALRQAGAALPDIANVTAKQELRAAKQLEAGAKSSAAVAKRVSDAIFLIEDQRAQIESLTSRGSPSLANLRRFPRTGNIVPAPLRPAGQLGAPLLGFQPPPPPLPGQGPRRPLFGSANPIKVYAQFVLTMGEQIRQAQAAITKTTRDDVAAAKQVVARIKRVIDHGHLEGKALIQALQLESSALGTIWAAEQAAAQKRAAAAQAAKQRIQAQLENEIDPIKLEVALSRAQALGRPFVSILKQMRASAEAALRSGKLTLAQQKEAWDQITQLNGQIKDALTTASVTFQVPAKLALALAKDQALGRDDTKDLLKLKRAILNFIKHHRHNVAALTDAYNQLAAVNQQLGATASSALGLFKQASTKALTAGLGLTAAQRKALRERLAGLGPGGTVSGSGIGAAGFAIDPNTGRPITLDRHRRRRTADGGAAGTPIKVDNTIDLNVYIDGHHVETSITKRQQKRRRRNPSQRRGPNAGG